MQEHVTLTGQALRKRRLASKRQHVKSGLCWDVKLCAIDGCVTGLSLTDKLDGLHRTMRLMRVLSARQGGANGPNELIDGGEESL